MVLFGESLGAWASEDAFDDRGTDGLLALGIDRGLWIGTPYGCKWKDQVLGPPRPDVDKSLVGVFNDFGQVEAMDPEARARSALCDDHPLQRRGGPLRPGAARTETGLVGRSRAAASHRTGRSEKYSTPTTFIQTLIDTKNAGFELPGQFEATAHDYRADLARFIREVYACEATEDQMARIEDALWRTRKASATWLEEQANRKTEQAQQARPAR